MEGFDLAKKKAFEVRPPLHDINEPLRESCQNSSGGGVTSSGVASHPGGE